MSAADDVFVHERALCESDAVGSGTRIWAFAHVMAGAVVGSDCNLGNYVFVENGCRVGDRVTVKNGVQLWEGVTLEDNVMIGPCAVFTNDRWPRSPRRDDVKLPYDDSAWLEPITVKEGATVGANATLLPGVTIGANALVAAGAVVTRDVVPHALVAGNPARHMGWVCACGHRLRDDAPLNCPACGQTYAPGDAGLVPAEA